MASYLSSAEDVKKFLNNPNMQDQNGVMFAYATDPKVLAKLVPAPLEVVAPIVAGYVTYMGKPTFAKPYYEAVLYAMVKFGKIVGAYPFSLLLSGEGAEEAMIAGRDGASMPKKLADKIVFEQSDQAIHAEIVRHGVKLLDLNWQAGAPNDAAAAQQILGQAAGKLGEPAETASFFINYGVNQNEDGSNSFVNTELVATLSKAITIKLVPGSLKLNLASSEDDPFDELVVAKPIGAAWYQVKSSIMHQTLHLQKLDPAKVAPYLITGNYDRAMLNE
ncbi:MAG: acetoacetate decarboxylase family protein [Lactobacillus sp.]|jgi:acetoacetate decarboxylase|nr:acetoacetate decarboxylase family protein [Lactobacillus sp.]MCH3905658.1 acetoacetate decarboxylase family protein [Lactobacillus sp.]MCH3990784.1 acetoacetate decarboxylase family protein [Lactobacillus sp.]MCH4068500.1 acetoacetate decarboxylase family protein [Lactobacillus sp.]MCI1304249.1 acetoacetate decarboxylase family protein [Lactobacillus sp.]